MVTLEQKVDLLMRYAATDDCAESSRLLREIRNILSDTGAATPESTTTDISSPANDGLMGDVIDDLLKELGAPCRNIGYDYATRCLKLIISDNEYLHHITSRLYPAIAAEFNTTPSRVERALRHLIEVAWTRNDIRDAYRIFGNTIDINKGKPTNSEFLACCARVVKRRMRNMK